MGCVNSGSVRIYPTTQNAEISKPQRSLPPPESFVDPDVRSTFDTLTDSIADIRFPNGMVPVVCLNSRCVPLCLAPVAWDRDDPITVNLPVCAFSMVSNARIITLAHIGVIAREFYALEDTPRFIFYCIQWLFASDDLTPILLLSIPPLYLTDIQICLKSQQFAVACGTIDSDLQQYRVVLISSDLDMSNAEWRRKLQGFVSAGGGLMCLHVPSHCDEEVEAAVNPLLFEYGLAFSVCRLLTRKVNRIAPYLPDNVAEAMRCQLSFLVGKFGALVRQEPEASHSALDEVVTTLRYHLLVADARYGDEFGRLWRDCHHFLEKTGYVGRRGVCPRLSQGIVVLLLRELRAKVPAEAFRMVDAARDFPGYVEALPAGTFALAVQLRAQRWIGTGLWLQPGVVGVIEGAFAGAEVRVQIGAHDRDLTERQGPWKRWPLMLAVWRLGDAVTRVATETGGIVYFVVGDLEDAAEATFVFDGFARYPRFSLASPDVWEATRASGAPWGELEAPDIVVTLPTARLRDIPDLRACCALLDKITKSVISFMNYDIIRPYRVVFDIETATAGIHGYPIKMPMAAIDNILMPIDGPTSEIFNFIRALAIVSIREGCLDDVTEHAIGSLITMAVLQIIFPGFDPGALEVFARPPLLFRELWFIHTQINKRLLPKILEDLQRPEATVHASPEDMWIEFVTALSFLADCDMGSIFGKVRALPMSVITMLKELPEPPRHL